MIADIIQSTAAKLAREIRTKLDAAALEVLRSGGNWAEGPYEFTSSDPFPLEPRSLFEPVSEAVTVKAGPVPDDWVPPHGWRMIRHSDWIAAGQPGHCEGVDPMP